MSQKLKKWALRAGFLAGGYMLSAFFQKSEQKTPQGENKLLLSLGLFFGAALFVHFAFSVMLMQKQFVF